MEQITFILFVSLLGFFLCLLIYLSTKNFNLNSIQAKTVGQGQHGTARFATSAEIKRAYVHIPFLVKQWRKGLALPHTKGIIVGCVDRAEKTIATLDQDDVHCLMIGASGVGKTAYFLYPNLEYTCATGTSFLTTDTKGDLYRNYGTIASKYYGYEISVIDLRNPTRSHEFNMLSLVNKYMDLYISNPKDIQAKSKAERYAKITAKTIIYSTGDTDYGQNQYFYDSAEGLLASVILIISEFSPKPKRHIISVFKLLQELMAPSNNLKGGSEFKTLLDQLPETHKAKWLAGSALYTSDQSMQSILSTCLSRLNAFIDSELEQILCFGTSIDAETFCKRKCALFIVLPEEDNTKYFLATLIIQQLYRELLVCADEQGGKLKDRVIFYLEEAGTLPPIQSAELMQSASRSRGIQMVWIIQSLAQLEKNYQKEGAEIIVDNCQLSIFGGFAPNSKTAEVMAQSLGNKTVLSGSVSKGKNDPSQTLQMIERPLMTVDELKSLPKGDFVVMKTGTHPIKTKLKLFFKWGIQFDDPYQIEEHASRSIPYITKQEIIKSITGSDESLLNSKIDSELKFTTAIRKGKVKVDD